MRDPQLILILVLVLGVVSKSGILIAAAAFLILLQSLHLTRLMGFVESRSLEIGLVFLMISIIAPFAHGNLSAREVARNLVTIPGALTLLGALAATRLNLGGLELLRSDPSLMLSIVIGSIAGVAFLKGIPVGPLMAAGLAWVLIGLWQRFFG